MLIIYILLLLRMSAYAYALVKTSLKVVRAKISNIDFFLKILLLKDDELVMSEK